MDQQDSLIRYRLGAIGCCLAVLMAGCSHAPAPTPQPAVTSSGTDIRESPRPQKDLTIPTPILQEAARATYTTDQMMETGSSVELGGLDWIAKMDCTTRSASDSVGYWVKVDGKQFFGASSQCSSDFTFVTLLPITNMKGKHRVDASLDTKDAPSLISAYVIIIPQNFI